MEPVGASSPGWDILIPYRISVPFPRTPMSAMRSATVGGLRPAEGVDHEHVLPDRGVALDHLARGQHVALVLAEAVGENWTLPPIP